MIIKNCNIKHTQKKEKFEYVNVKLLLILLKKYDIKQKYIQKSDLRYYVRFNDQRIMKNF